MRTILTRRSKTFTIKQFIRAFKPRHWDCNSEEMRR